jgi:hypothetical protein
VLDRLDRKHHIEMIAAKRHRFQRAGDPADRGRDVAQKCGRQVNGGAVNPAAGPGEDVEKSTFPAAHLQHAVPGGHMPKHDLGTAVRSQHTRRQLGSNPLEELADTSPIRQQVRRRD